MTAKKAAAKKAAPQKTTTKKTASKTTTATPPDPDDGTAAPHDPVVAVADPSGAQPLDSKSVISVAEEILNNSRRWGSGRERSIALQAAGFKPADVQREVSRLRAKRRREQNS